MCIFVQTDGSKSSSALITTQHTVCDLSKEMCTFSTPNIFESMNITDLWRQTRRQDFCRRRYHLVSLKISEMQLQTAMYFAPLRRLHELNFMLVSGKVVDDIEGSSSKAISHPKNLIFASRKSIKYFDYFEGCKVLSPDSPNNLVNRYGNSSVSIVRVLTNYIK